MDEEHQMHLQHGNIPEDPDDLSRIDLLRESKKLSMGLKILEEAISAAPPRLSQWTSNWDLRWADLIDSAKAQIQRAFAMPHAPTSADTRLNIQRFESVQRALCSRVQASFDSTQEQLCRRFPVIIASLARQHWHDRTGGFALLSRQDQSDLIAAVRSSFLQILSEELISFLDTTFVTPLAIGLEESLEVKNKRDALNAQITRLGEAYTLIDEL